MNKFAMFVIGAAFLGAGLWVPVRGSGYHSIEIRPMWKFDGALQHVGREDRFTEVTEVPGHFEGNLIPYASELSWTFLSNAGTIDAGFLLAEYGIILGAGLLFALLCHSIKGGSVDRSSTK